MAFFVYKAAKYLYDNRDTIGLLAYPVGIVAGYFGLIYRDRIIEYVDGSINNAYDNWFERKKIVIPSDGKKMMCILNQEIIKSGEITKTILAETAFGLRHVPDKGSYKLTIDGVDIMCHKSIDAGNESFELEIYGKTPISKLQNILDDLQKKYFHGGNKIMHYYVEDNKWTWIPPRDPLDIASVKMNNEIEQVLDSVDKSGFRTRSVGMILHGKAGTSKTTIIEILASRYGMNIYNMHFNNNGLSDGALAKLLAEIPPKSILAIDEMNSQLERALESDNTNISLGGVLGALDGTTRMNPYTLVVITTNDYDKLVNMFPEETLTRYGRGEYKFHMTRQFSPASL